MTSLPTPDRDGRPSTSHLGWAPSVGQDIVATGLLIAMPSLTDPNFRHAVIYLLDHSDQGSVGIVLNRPSEVRLEHVLPTWAPLATGTDVFHVGGPCQTDTAMCLVRGELLDAHAGAEHGRGREELAGSGLKPAGTGMYLADLDVEPVPSAALISDIRVFAGYAGWAAGQLAAEMADGAWLCVPALPGDAFTSAPTTLWRRVLSRQRGALSILRSAPLDPAAN